MNRIEEIRAAIERYYDRLLEAARCNRVNEIKELHHTVRLLRLTLYELMKCESLIDKSDSVSDEAVGSLLSFRPTASFSQMMEVDGDGASE
jgi:hypothetical protein